MTDSIFQVFLSSQIWLTPFTHFTTCGIPLILHHIYFHVNYIKTQTHYSIVTNNNCRLELPAQLETDHIDILPHICIRISSNKYYLHHICVSTNRDNETIIFTSDWSWASSCGSKYLIALNLARKKKLTKQHTLIPIPYSHSTTIDIRDQYCKVRGF